MPRHTPAERAKRKLVTATFKARAKSDPKIKAIKESFSVKKQARTKRSSTFKVSPPPKNAPKSFRSKINPRSRRGKTTLEIRKASPRLQSLRRRLKGRTLRVKPKGRFKLLEALRNRARAR